AVQPRGMPVPPLDFGPPPYEPPMQPGYIPPPVSAEGPPPSMGYYPAAGHYPAPGGHTATVIVPSGTATTVTVLQGEIFQATPVQTVCPHCQQAITTAITHEIGLMNFFLGFFCCFVGYVREEEEPRHSPLLSAQGSLRDCGREGWG
uniref:Cell death-inducing p53-target protein 1 n=1 Tax=Pelusios castaneus TaxID=367368 RepID=A0A8C8SRZ0_9SAUR